MLQIEIIIFIVYILKLIQFLKNNVKQVLVVLIDIKPLEGFDNSKLIIESNKRIDILQKQIVVQSKSLDEIAVLAEEKEKLLAAIPAIQPVSNEDLTRMASGYGMRSDPFTKARKMHWGMDFTAPRGTPIYASWRWGC